VERRRLVWKREGGYEDGEVPAGPAWLDTLDDDKVTASERLRGGEWIPRAEAVSLAEENGYELLLDDPTS
jgi:hypothetical protein